MSESKPLRKRQWTMTVFPEAECYSTFLETLAKEHNLRYAVIKHNKDMEADNKPKREHYHVVLDYTNARGFDALRSKFEGGHLEICKYIDSAIQYLVHKNNPEKHQYNVEEVSTNDIEWLNEAMYHEIIVSQHFDFNKVPTYYKEYKERDQKEYTFIPYLLARFPKDRYEVISKVSKIDLLIQFLGELEKSETALLKEEVL